jgi:hypothetical protein
VSEDRQSSVLRSLVLSTAADALRGEEVDRTRGFVRLGGPFALAAIVATLLLPGDPELRRILVVALAVTALISVVVFRSLRDASDLHSPAMSVLAVACVGCGMLATVYCGYFSSAPLVIALGIYFFCRTESRTAAYAIYGLVAVSHLAIAI